jgi:ribosomal protein L11 methylase PrmA
MSAGLSGSCLPPSSSLPPIRSLITASEEKVTTALKNLQALYCPLRLSASISTTGSKRDQAPTASTHALVDSGYASRCEDEDEGVASEEVTAILRADPFERTFTTKWLTALIARSEEMDLDDDAREGIVDSAGSILSAFFESTEEEEEEALTRDFSFPMPSGESINVTLNDAPLSGTDHTDVGLQSWGASIVLSSMMCMDTKRFGLNQGVLPETANIIELGAGTGLVSLTLAKLLPEIGIQNASISATDYHPAVVANCNANIELNFPSVSECTRNVETAILDWATPPAHLKYSSDLLIASDVVYALEHAAWLRDCAAHLLRPSGTFWLMVTVRKHGKFEGVPDTVEAAFAENLRSKHENGRAFRILNREFLEKRRGIGRGDETGYNLYRIGWA